MKRLAWCLIYGFAGLAQAAINDVTFHGTLVSPPACTISDGKTIEVEFRNVIIDNINGDNFRQDVDAPRDKCAHFREINGIAAAFQHLQKNYNPIASSFL